MSETFCPLATDRDAMQDKAMEKIKRPLLGWELEISFQLRGGVYKSWAMGLFSPHPSKLLLKMFWRHRGEQRSEHRGTLGNTSRL